MSPPIVEAPKPRPVQVVQRGPQGLSAFAVWKLSHGTPTSTEDDFYRYLAALVPGGGGGGGVQLSYQINGVSSFQAKHSLTGRPVATLLTPSGRRVYADTDYADGVVTLTFPAPFTGVLYLG